MDRRRVKRSVFFGSGAALVVLVGGAAWTGNFEIALSGLAVMLGALGLLALDLRGRAADLSHGQRLAAERSRSLAASVRRISERQAEMKRGQREFRNRQQEAERRTARFIGSVSDALGSAAEDRSRVAAVERRLIAAFEAERLRSGDRHRELTGALDLGSAINRQLAELAIEVRQSNASLRTKFLNGMRNLHSDVSQDVEALLQLQNRVESRALLPASGGWALNPRSLAHLLDLVSREQPKVVLELGSGTSTIWLAYLFEGTSVRFISVDHDESYAARTLAELRRHGLETVVDLRLAPLAEVPPADGDEPESARQWYDPSAFGDVTDIGLLIVDGPPKSTGRIARWPALQHLRSRLASNAVILLDDADRPEELEVLTLWKRELPDATVDDEGVSRLAVLRLNEATGQESAG